MAARKTAATKAKRPPASLPAARSDGRWVKGQSGNPGGRAKLVGHVREAAKQYTAEAIETLAAIMRDGGAPHASRAAAAQALLDRAWGKPSLPVGGADDLPPVRVSTIEIVAIEPEK